MANLVYEVRKGIFELCNQKSFVDPVTKLRPAFEKALSALLVFYHQKEAIKWEAVPLYSLDYERTGLAANSIISERGMISSEYPLLYGQPEQLAVWGGMNCDVLYLTGNFKRIVFFENKIGSGFTYGCGSADGQIARQIDYLVESRIPEKFFLLVSSELLFNKKWYFNELREALKYDESRECVTGYLISWEDILNAFRTV